MFYFNDAINITKKIIENSLKEVLKISNWKNFLKYQTHITIYF